MSNSSIELNLMFNEIQVDGYEKVVEISDQSLGLRSIIAIHDTRLGPAIGGTRVFPYQSFDQALNDVLRLAKGMTYKAAVAQTGTGGAKSVIIYDGKTPKPEELLLAFAEAVNSFQGKYICAEDVGMSPSDLTVVREGTQFVVGLPSHKSSGDPSRFTARGGFKGIQAVCQKLWGSPSVKGKKIAIQGLGAVGMKLANFLFWEGAELIVADIDSCSVEHAVKEFSAKAVSPEEILTVECDILAPCALGGILSEKIIPSLRCKAIAGLANNQLLTEEDGDLLHARKILYAPDYVINSGGLLNVCVEVNKMGYNPTIARKQIDRLYDILLEIFTLSDEKKIGTNRVAKEIAEHNLKQGIGKRTEKMTFHH